MASITDVAKLAGVSVSTVSRVLNNNYMVSEKKKTKILEAIKELNYEPNTYSKHAKEERNNIILVVCTNILETALDGIKDAAENFGYDIMVDYIGFKTPKSNALKYLQNGFISGVIFLSVFDYSEDLLKVMNEYPNVQCGEYIKNKFSSSVSIDDENAAYEMTDLIIKSGRKNIAYINFNREFKFSIERELGVKRAIYDNNELIDNFFIKKVDYSFEAGVEVAKELLDMKNKPDAIFCAQDLIAAGVVEHLKEKNIKIPDEIMIVGFDNHEISEMTKPRLTTVAQPFYEMGRESVRALVSIIEYKANTGKKIYLNHEIYIRESANL